MLQRARKGKGIAAAESNDSYYYDNDDDDAGDLPDLGPSRYLAESAHVQNVLQAIRHIQDSMFADMPTTRVGMNSVRIADVLNFRRALPPIVSTAHVHMLIDNPTAVEKEVLSLVENGTIRRILLPGRGSDSASVGDCLIVVDDWKRLVQESTFLEQSLKDKYIRLLEVNRNSWEIDSSSLTQEELSQLVSAGFLVRTSAIAWSTTVKASAPPSSNRLPTAKTTASHTLRNTSMSFSIPNLGSYLKLLAASRAHLLALFKRSTSSEAPMYLLRDRWCGAVESSTPNARINPVPGGQFGALWGKTKMWKDLYGLNFKWVLEEAVGAGLVELFDTGSVGPGVRRL